MYEYCIECTVITESEQSSGLFLCPHQLVLWWMASSPHTNYRLNYTSLNLITLRRQSLFSCFVFLFYKYSPGRGNTRGTGGWVVWLYPDTVTAIRTEPSYILSLSQDLVENNSLLQDWPCTDRTQCNTRGFPLIFSINSFYYLNTIYIVSWIILLDLFLR